MRHAWEDLINDFLEVACRLNPAEREVAINALKRENIAAEHLEVHPAFSIDGKIMVVLKPGQLKECWFYFLEQKKIEKRNLGEDGALQMPEFRQAAV